MADQAGNSDRDARSRRGRAGRVWCSVSNRPFDSACHVEIDDDLLAENNRFHVPMRIKDRRQICSWPLPVHDARVKGSSSVIVAPICWPTP